MDAVIATIRGMGTGHAWRNKGREAERASLLLCPLRAERAMAETDGKIETVLHRLFESIRTS